MGIDVKLLLERFSAMVKVVYSHEQGQLKPGEQDRRHEVGPHLWPPMSSLRRNPALFERNGVELIHRFIITGRSASVQSDRTGSRTGRYLGQRAPNRPQSAPPSGRYPCCQRQGSHSFCNRPRVPGTLHSNQLSTLLTVGTLTMR